MISTDQVYHRLLLSDNNALKDDQTIHRYALHIHVASSLDQGWLHMHIHVRTF